MSKPDWLRKAESDGLIAGEVKVNRNFFTPASKAFVKGQEDLLATAATAGAPGHASNISLSNFQMILDSGNADAIPESFFQQVFEAYTIHWGWLTYHFRPAMTKDGKWETPVSGSGAGLLDNVCVRERVVYAELKSEKGELSFEQAKLVERLEEIGQEVYVWKPSDWKDIVRIMQTPMGIK